MGKKERHDSEWIVEVESSLKKESRPDRSHRGLIHTVPKSLLHNSDRAFYHPHVISFGPYHFRKEDVLNDDIERLKSEVARKMHLKIIQKFSSEDVNSLNVHKNYEGSSGSSDEHVKIGLKRVTEKFKKEDKQNRLKQSYAKDFKLGENVCAWMMVRDACFVLEVLERFGEDEGKANGISEGAEMSTLMDSILSRKRHHPLLTEIVKDMLKMENQLPFWVLKEIRNDIEGSTDTVWLESAFKLLSPIKISCAGKLKDNEGTHILQLLHDYIVDSPVADRKRSLRWTELLNFRLKWLFALIFFPVFVMLFILGIIFVSLHYIKNHIFHILYSIINFLSQPPDEPEEHVPSIGELRRGGMKFKKLDGGIKQIKFDKNNSTLYLPEFKVDDRSEVILRNLIALEICSKGEEKPITRYAILMNDLVDSTKDVSLLRSEDIITGKLGNDEEIARLWNSMVTPTEIPRYEFIDNAVKSINGYHKKWQKRLAFLRHRRLWGDFIGLLLEFIRTYGSRPWWFFSALIVLAILVLTVVQVFCLFKSCQHQ